MANIHTILLVPILSVILLTSPTEGGGGLLLPLAAITGHGGLYASSFTSAALMKLKVATALAALAGISESGFHFRVGHGAPHFNEPHHGGGGWGWSRKRRSTTEEEEPSLDQVLSYDQLGCGLRLVCELAATPAQELKDDGKLILELFGRDGKTPPNHTKSSRGKLSYSYASLLGENAKDSSACGKVYANCPYDKSEIMEAIRGN